MEKQVAINIFEDIEGSLYDENWKEKTLSTIKLYKKGLLVATNNKLKELIKEYNKYDEDSVQAKKLAKKIDDEIRKIYNQ